MKKLELYKLSKRGLYFIYNDLHSSGITEKELEKVQFFDELPSQILWESFISKIEKRVLHFQEDLTLLKRNVNYDDLALANLDICRIFF